MNASIAELTRCLVDSLIRGDLTAKQLRQGMEYAFEGGRIDGELAACQRMLEKTFPAEKQGASV